MSDKPSKGREPRRNVPLPILVRGFDRDGRHWDEMTTSKDVSYGGVGFLLGHPVAVGQVLELSLPLPKAFRRHDPANPSYHVFAIVRNAGPEGKLNRVGVMFYGKRPPRGFKDNPSARFVFGGETIEAPKAHQSRRFPRFSLVFNTQIVWHPPGAKARDEVTITEELAEGGARVLTTLPVEAGDAVSLDIDAGSVIADGDVRNTYIGADGIKRLNVQFRTDAAGAAARELLRRAGAS